MGLTWKLDASARSAGAQDADDPSAKDDTINRRKSLQEMNGIVETVMLVAATESAAAAVAGGGGGHRLS